MSTKPKKAVYWIRMEIAGYDMLAAHQKARRALLGVYRSTGVETASMVTETDLMRMIRNGITDAMTGEDDSSTEQSAAPRADRKAEKNK